MESARWDAIFSWLAFPYMGRINSKVQENVRLRKLNVRSLYAGFQELSPAQVDRLFQNRLLSHNSRKKYDDDAGYRWLLTR